MHTLQASTPPVVWLKRGCATKSVFIFSAFALRLASTRATDACRRFAHVPWHVCLSHVVSISSIHIDTPACGGLSLRMNNKKTPGHPLSEDATTPSNRSTSRPLRCVLCLTCADAYVGGCICVWCVSVFHANACVIDVHGARLSRLSADPVARRCLSK